MQTIADEVRQQFGEDETKESNPMKELEERTLATKREMELLDELDDLRTRNARNERSLAETAMKRLKMDAEEAKSTEARQLAEDEAIAKAVFASARKAAAAQKEAKRLVEPGKEKEKVKAEAKTDL